MNHDPIPAWARVDPEHFTEEEALDQYRRRCVDIDNSSRETLNDEYIKLPADLAFWLARHAVASDELMRAEHAASVCWARTNLTIREVQARMADKKPTEGVIESLTTVDKGVQAAELARIDAAAKKATAWTVVEALKAKKDSLVSLGANMRADMNSDPTLRTRDESQTWGGKKR